MSNGKSSTKKAALCVATNIDRVDMAWLKGTCDREDALESITNMLAIYRTHYPTEADTMALNIAMWRN